MKITKIMLLIIPILVFVFTACTDNSATDEETVELQRFENPNYEFTTNYPGDWIYEETEGIVLFSGKPNTDAYYTTVNIQTLDRQGEGGFSDFETLYESYNHEFTQAGGEVSEIEEFLFVQEGQEFPMMKFQAEYSAEGETFRQIIQIIEKDDYTFYQIAYTAALDLFEISEGIANEMLESFEMELN